MLLEETEATALERLRTLPMGAPLNRVSQRRHLCDYDDVSVERFGGKRACGGFECEDVAAILKKAVLEGGRAAEF